jgi:hypothetical protein
MTQTPETSKFTGAKDRIDDMTDREGTKKQRHEQPSHAGTSLALEKRWLDDFGRNQ